MRSMVGALGLVITLGVSTWAHAETLSEVALYHRCYVRLTGLFPDYTDDEGLRELRAGRRGALEACLLVLDRATLQPTGAVEQPLGGDPIGARVLRRFHDLHSSWFLNRRFAEFDDISLGTESLYDPTEPAAYITRALFNRAVPASSILNAREHLRVLRASGGRSLYELGAEDFAFDDPPILSTGPMLGVEVAGPLPRAYRLPEPEDESGAAPIPPEGRFDIGAHYGGGFLGSSSYLLLNVNEPLDFVANGGRKMPRKWAKAVLRDVLCRDLPAVRVEDAIPFVVAESRVPFRRQANCTQCHASIDRIASTIRGFAYASLAGEGVPNGGYFGVFRTTTGVADRGWPAVEDAAYGQGPALGTLYYRDYAGRLVELPLEGPGDLGQKLAERDGPYICLAQRYYRYLTGIEAYIGDPQYFPADAGGSERRHRDKVIALGQELRRSQDLRALIEAILRSPDYRESDFGASR